MQTSLYSVNGSGSSLSVGFESKKRLKVLAPAGLVGGLRNRSCRIVSSFGENGCMSYQSNCFGLRSSDSVSMATELVRAPFRRPRSVKAIASGKFEFFLSGISGFRGVMSGIGIFDGRWRY